MQQKCVPLLRYRRPSVAGHAEAGSSQLNFGPRAEHRDGCRRAARSRNRATPSTPTPTRAAVGNNSRASPSPRAIPILYPIGRGVAIPAPRTPAAQGRRKSWRTLARPSLPSTPISSLFLPSPMCRLDRVRAVRYLLTDPPPVPRTAPRAGALLGAAGASGTTRSVGGDTCGAPGATPDVDVDDAGVSAGTG